MGWVCLLWTLPIEGLKAGGPLTDPGGTFEVATAGLIVLVASGVLEVEDWGVVLLSPTREQKPSKLLKVRYSLGSSVESAEAQEEM